MGLSQLKIAMHLVVFSLKAVKSVAGWFVIGDVTEFILKLTALKTIASIGCKKNSCKTSVLNKSWMNVTCLLPYIL